MEQEKEPYSVEIQGRTFQVLPGVFSPKYFHDTAFFIDSLPNLEGDFLEIGPGTGAISIFAMFKGANKVTAIDIDPVAVKNTKINIQKHGLEGRIKVLNGDIFGPLKDKYDFNFIFWNVPFIFTEKKDLSFVEKTVFDSNYESLNRFIKEAVQYLGPKGCLLIGFSSTMGRIEILLDCLSQNNFSHQIIARSNKEYNSAGPVDLELIEARLL